LVEVLLAIFIAIGVLVVLLYFYEQATNLRTQVIQETERIGAARLIMDRITGELRASRSEVLLGQGFVGTSNSLQFVKADVPSFDSWTGGTLGRSASPVTDLRLVKYRLQSNDETNIIGLLRTDEPLIGKPQPTNSLSIVQDEFEDEFNMIPMVSSNSLPVLEEIRFLQFRYWSGTNWVDTWNAGGRPQGIEVSMGPEPATNDTESAEYKPEVFRRVIYLPPNFSTQQVVMAAQTQDTNAPPAEEAP